MTGPDCSTTSATLSAHRLVVAAEHGRAAGLQEVDVLVAVDVPQARALGLLDGQREGVVEGEVVLHAAGDELHRRVGQLLAAAAVRVEPGEVAVHDVAADGADGLGDEVAQPPVDVGDVRIAADGVAGELGAGGARLAGRAAAGGPARARARLRPPAPPPRPSPQRRAPPRRRARPGLLDLGRQLLLVLAQLLEGDLADRQRDLLGAAVGEQREQVVERDLLEQRHVVHGLLGVAAEHEHAVVLEDVRVGAARELLRHVLLEEARPRRGVRDELDRAAEVAHLFVEQGGDRPLHQRERARVRLVRVDDDAHVVAPLVHRRVHRGLDRGLLRAQDVPPVESEDADVAGLHLAVVVARRRDRVGVLAGHAHGDVALGRLEVAAVEQRAADVDDELARRGVVAHAALLFRSRRRSARWCRRPGSRLAAVSTQIVHVSVGSGRWATSAARTRCAR